MTTAANPISAISKTVLEDAARAGSISMDSAERALKIQLEFAKGALKRATANAQAASQVKDVQELLALRTVMAETALENFMGYSRSLYEIASSAQTEFSRLAEQRMAKLQAAVSETVEQATASAPAGSDVAVAAIKSQLAAATAAFDSFNKAAKHMASFADAGVSASKPAKSRK